MSGPVNSPVQCEDQPFRLIITRRDGTEILLATSDRQWALPQVSASRKNRLAEQLASDALTQYGIKAYCLFIPRLGTVHETNLELRYAVLEALAQNAKPPAGLYWMPSRSVVRRPTLPAEDRAAVESAFEEIACYAAEPSKGPFARPGWMRDLFEWVDSHIRPLGLRVTGSFQQFNASPAFSLMRIETTGPALWFKATGKPNREELTITRELARVFPRYVPKLVAVRSDWNGWLAWEAPGLELDSLGDARAWESAARNLAELQIASIGRIEELLECGCRDFRARQLSRQIGPLLAAMRDCMQAQEKLSPPPLTSTELDRLGHRLAEACSALEQLDLPNTIGHLDFNPGNILVSPERAVFLDWAEACVTSPFITYNYLREHFRRRFGGTAARESIAAAYLAPWQALFPSHYLARGMILARPVAVLAYAIRCRAERPEGAGGKFDGAGYLRSLTRRMYGEVLALEERNEPCLP